MRGGVDIPPALTVVTQALMALIFGFIGLMVAVPLLAAVMVPVKMLYVEDVVGDPIEVLDEGDEGDDGDG
jgi:predicted PurR-regulated permease PerM